MNAVSIKSPYGTHIIPTEPSSLTDIAQANNLSPAEMSVVLNKLVDLKLVKAQVWGSVGEDGMIDAFAATYCASPAPRESSDIFSDADDTSLCPYKEWTGKPLPTSAEELIEEYERLCEPTYIEYSDAKIAARNAVWDALEKFRA
jgi:hypothetical protein